MSQVLTGSAGAFTAPDQSRINQSFSQIQADYFVDANFGFDGNPGTSPGLAFRTMTPLTLALTEARFRTSQPYTVALCGVLSQQWSGPKIADVTLVGAAGRPRQATTGGVPNGGGATWLSPSNLSNSLPLLQVQGQGWTVKNIFFNNSATGAPCVQVLTDGTGDPPLSADGAHFLLQGCILTGTDDGFNASGGTNWVTLDGNLFFGFSGSGDIAISNLAGAGIGTLTNWEIKNNEFKSNANHIICPVSNASIHHNHFTYIDGGVTTSVFYSASGGANNAVWKNVFDVDSGNGGIATMFVLGTNDRFSANALSTAVTTTQFSWGDPA